MLLLTTVVTDNVAPTMAFVVFLIQVCQKKNDRCQRCTGKLFLNLLFLAQAMLAVTFFRDDATVLRVMASAHIASIAILFHQRWMV